MFKLSRLKVFSKTIEVAPIRPTFSPNFEYCMLYSSFTLGNVFSATVILILSRYFSPNSITFPYKIIISGLNIFMAFEIPIPK